MEGAPDDDQLPEVLNEAPVEVPDPRKHLANMALGFFGINPNGGTDPRDIATGDDW